MIKTKGFDTFKIWKLHCLSTYGETTSIQSVLLLKWASGGKTSKWDAAMASPSVEDVKGFSSSHLDIYTSLNQYCVQYSWISTINIYCYLTSVYTVLTKDLGLIFLSIFCVFPSPHPRLYSLRCHQTFAAWRHVSAMCPNWASWEHLVSRREPGENQHGGSWTLSSLSPSFV